MAYEKALSLITGGGGITTYPIVYDSETSQEYVEVTYSELLEKVKSGLVLFIVGNSEISCQTYFVGAVDEEGAHTLFPQGTSNIFHTWTYTNGKYVHVSGD